MREIEIKGERVFLDDAIVAAGDEVIRAALTASYADAATLKYTVLDSPEEASGAPASTADEAPGDPNDVVKVEDGTGDAEPRPPGVEPTPEATVEAQAAAAPPEPWGPEWQRATVVVTLRLLPEDDHVDGRRVVIVAHDEGGLPLTGLTRAGLLRVEDGPLHDIMRRLSVEMPARAAARKDGAGKAATATKTEAKRTTATKKAAG